MQTAAPRDVVQPDALLREEPPERPEAAPVLHRVTSVQSRAVRHRPPLLLRLSEPCDDAWARPARRSRQQRRSSPAHRFPQPASALHRRRDDDDVLLQNPRLAQEREVAARPRRHRGDDAAEQQPVQSHELSSRVPTAL